MENYSEVVYLSGRPFSVKFARTPEELAKNMAFRATHFHLSASDDEQQQRAPVSVEDEYDALADHLMVTDLSTQQVVGSYRLLNAEQAAAGNGYYSETEFDLTPIKQTGRSLLEVGRACIDASYINYNIIALLWRGIANYCKHHDVDYLCGCASLPVENPSLSSLIYHFAATESLLVAADMLVKPIASHVDHDFDWCPRDMNSTKMRAQIPPLMRGYFSLNCKLASLPAYDPIFNVKDFLFLLDFREQVSQRRISRFVTLGKCETSVAC